MADIHVEFPTEGGVRVTRDTQAVMGDEFITWYVRSGDKNIRKVRIQFDKSDGEFFPTHSGKQAKLDKKFTYTDEKGRGIALIWGLAPIFKNKRRDDKYTIVGLDDKGNALPSRTLDPMIITDTPPPTPDPARNTN